MVIKTGKITILKSQSGEYPTYTITDGTITNNGKIVLTPAELDSLTDTRGQMEFYAQVSVGQVVITGEMKELKDDTDLYYVLDTNGAGSAAPAIETDPVFETLNTASVKKILYVDGNRVDVYVENGSFMKPYKTIQAAVNAIALIGSSSYYTIKIANGVYVENVVLENAGLKYINLEGNGYVSINPASGNALQSAATNDNLFALYISNIVFAKPVVLTGSNGATSFSDTMLDGIDFTGTSSLTATCINNLSMRNVYSERPFIYNNVAWSYIESGQLQGTFSITMNDGADYPSGGKDGTILANGIFESAAVSYTIGGTATITIAPNGCRWGAGATTIPAGVSIIAYNSYLRGTLTNNGVINLRNSTMEGYVAGLGTLNLNGYPAFLTPNPTADGTYPVYNDGITSGQLMSITVLNGLITAVTVVP